jgi:hypothetical protein
MSDDAHDQMMPPTAAQRLAADAAAKRRAEIASDPSLALSEPVKDHARVWLVLVVLVLGAILAWPVFAIEVPTCQARQKQVDAISGPTFGERFFVNWKDPKGVNELWINPETGTWTMLRTQGDTSCIIGSGIGEFETEPYLPIVVGDPA